MTTSERINAKILNLRVGELVADSAGAIGEVIGFGRDTVKIDWGGAVQHYTNEDIKARGIVKVDGQ